MAQAPVVSTLTSASTSESQIGEIPPLPVLDTVDQVRLEAVGQPPSVVSASVPPSVPVFVRRNTLLSIHGNWRTISASSVAPDWLKRFLYGNHVARYLRLVATDPFSLLVTANTPTLVPSFVSNVTPKSIAPVTLDGLSDWAILKRDALHIYAGPSLNIGLYPVPRRILRRFARVIGSSSRQPTGLAHWARWGYTFVSGRGVIGLAGHGLLYAATVGDGEELSVNKDSLVAVSVNGPHDLQNCVVQHSYPGEAPVAEPVPPRMARVTSWADFVVNTKYYWWKVAHLFRSADTPSVLLGRTEFVRVFGPRAVLLQSGNPRQAFERNFRLPELPTATETPAKSPEDYLNIVTVGQAGTPSIQSTKNFKDAVRAIEKKS